MSVTLSHYFNNTCSVYLLAFDKNNNSFPWLAHSLPTFLFYVNGEYKLKFKVEVVYSKIVIVTNSNAIQNNILIINHYYKQKTKAIISTHLLKIKSIVTIEPLSSKQKY